MRGCVWTIGNRHVSFTHSVVITNIAALCLLHIVGTLAGLCRPIGIVVY